MLEDPDFQKYIELNPGLNHFPLSLDSSSSLLNEKMTDSIFHTITSEEFISQGPKEIPQFLEVVRASLMKLKLQGMVRYILPLALALLGISLQSYFHDLVGGKMLLFLSPALFIGAILSGFGPGVVATAFISSGAWFYLVFIRHYFTLESVSDFFGLIVFIFMGILFSIVGGILRANRARERKHQSLLDLTNKKLLFLNHQQIKLLQMVSHELKCLRKDKRELSVTNGLNSTNSPTERIVTGIISDIAERKKREWQAQFLAKAGRVLAETFEDVNPLKKMADLVVNEISDGCAVRLLGEAGELVTVAVAHRNPRMQDIVESLVKSLGVRNSFSTEIYDALKTDSVQMRNDSNEVRSADIKMTDDEKRYLDQIGEHDSATIPLKVRGKVIGLLSLMSDKSRWHFEDSDREFLQSLGTQVALSIENSRLYNKAQHAIKLREEILAIVSHDLKTPLMTIQIAGKILPRSTDNQKLLNLSQKILKSTEQMDRMIADLMDFAKIQEGNLSIEKSLEDPKELLDMVFEMMKAQAEAKNLELSLEVPNPIPAIHYDKHRIAQALLNLVGNAIKFTGPGGKVKIAAVKKEGVVLFSVTDTGPGISKEDLPKIFDRYWQAKRSKTISAGLGLSITKGILYAHGALIDVESELGRGTTFSFALKVFN